MIRTGYRQVWICLSLLFSLPVWAGGNSLLVPAPVAPRCVLDVEAWREAVQRCQQLAVKGDAQAAFELGVFYKDVAKVPNPSQALHWFEQASLRGHAQAQHRLGLMFFHGEGVSVNRVQAYIVLKMASVNGDAEALDSADEVAAQMSQEEQSEASQVLGQIFRNYLMELQSADEQR